MKKLVLLLLSFNLNAAVVVIDPGHGGEERGAISKIDHSIEKNLVLVRPMKLKKKAHRKTSSISNKILRQKPHSR